MKVKNTYEFNFFGEDDGSIERSFRHEHITNGEDYATEIIDQFLLFLSSVFGYSITREWLASRTDYDVDPETTIADTLSMGGTED